MLKRINDNVYKIKLPKGVNTLGMFNVDLPPYKQAVDHGSDKEEAT